MHTTIGAVSGSSRRSRAFSLSSEVASGKLREVDAVPDHSPPRADAYPVAQACLRLADAHDLVRPTSGEPLPGNSHTFKSAERLKRPAVRLKERRSPPPHDQATGQTGNGRVQVDHVRVAAPTIARRRAISPPSESPGILWARHS